MTEIETYIKELESKGWIEPNCKSCKAYFYPELQKGNKFSSIFAPGHKPSSRCESGKHPHCSCDTCF